MLARGSDQACEQEGCRYAALCNDYGQVQQRWLVFESENSRNRDLKALEKKLEKAQTEVSRQVKQLAKQEFECQDDVLK